MINCLIRSFTFNHGEKKKRRESSHQVVRRFDDADKINIENDRRRSGRRS